MSILEDLRQSVIDGEMNSTQELVQKALAEKILPEQILKDGPISAMTEVGRRFECGEYFVPELLISARAMKSGLALLRPYLIAANVQAVGKVVIGTVQGDLHDIGKNLVGMMLEGAGFEVVDLGADVSPDKYVAAVKEHRPDLVACSALLTTTMPRMKNVILSLKEAGLRDRVKVIIGGAPVTDQYATDIGADGYAPDAASAASRAKELILEKG
ncbi:MAG: methyltransferase [Chloroflexi bacterium RBG_19FT_COMBO_50_10]|nr:MAG: methyltransferase [Chloroflexi bacterium RBG_16_47_49]OGO63546.1 MAG: methyltransferase [Chloroflexi bacterium RBG_19FT_COMBO_50_10]